MHLEGTYRHHIQAMEGTPEPGAIREMITTSNTQPYDHTNGHLFESAGPLWQNEIGYDRMTFLSSCFFPKSLVTVIRTILQEVWDVDINNTNLTLVIQTWCDLIN